MVLLVPVRNRRARVRQTSHLQLLHDLGGVLGARETVAVNFEDLHRLVGIHGCLIPVFIVTVLQNGIRREGLLAEGVQTGLAVLLAVVARNERRVEHLPLRAQPKQANLLAVFKILAVHQLRNHLTVVDQFKCLEAHFLFFETAAE